jgi:hypothetical protein
MIELDGKPLRGRKLAIKRANEVSNLNAVTYVFSLTHTSLHAGSY